jgi:thymidylate kinase
MNKGPTTIALFGIDGSGKSTLAKHLGARLQAGAFGQAEAGLITCPRYHHAPKSPDPELSATLDRMNHGGDKLKSLEWKSIAVYLQLLLYGPARAALVSAGANPILSERHPLVDALVYGPYFSERLTRNLTETELAETYFPALEVLESGAEARVRAWHESENRRLKRELPLAELPLYLKGLFGQAPEPMLAELSVQFQTPLPDTAIFLDVSISTAVTRIDARGGQAELHENEAGLTKLRAGYLAAFAWLRSHHPEIRLVALAGESEGKTRHVNELADEVLRLGKDLR